MQGKVFKARLTDADKLHPHPYTVVLYFKNNKTCLLVPARTVGGAGVEGLIDTAVNEGRPKEAVAVQLDSKTSIDPEGWGHLTWWVTAEWMWCSRQEIIDRGQIIGTMKPDALAMLAKSILALNEFHNNRMFAQDIKNALLKAIADAE